jgi:hypothetical protein
MGVSSHVGARRPERTAPLFRSALLLTGILVASSAACGQEREPAEPYRFYGGEVDRSTATDPAVEACEYRLLVEERRCNETLNKSACIARVHEECRADPDGEGDGRGLTDSPGRPRR